MNFFSLGILVFFLIINDGAKAVEEGPLEALMRKAEVKISLGQTTLPDFYRALGHNAWLGVSQVRGNFGPGENFHDGNFTPEQLDKWMRLGFLNEATFALTGVLDTNHRDLRSVDDPTSVNDHITRIVYLLYYGKKNGFLKATFWAGDLRRKIETSLKMWNDRKIPTEMALLQGRSSIDNIIMYPNTPDKTIFDGDLEGFDALKVIDSVRKTKEFLSKDLNFLALGRLFHRQKLLLEEIEKFRAANYTSLLPQHKKEFNSFYDIQNNIANFLQYLLLDIIGKTIDNFVNISEEGISVQRMIPASLKTLVQEEIKSASPGAVTLVPSEHDSVGGSAGAGAGSAGAGAGSAAAVGSTTTTPVALRSVLPFSVEFDGTTPRDFLDKIDRGVGEATMTYTSVNGVEKRVDLNEYTTVIDDLDRDHPVTVTVNSSTQTVKSVPSTHNSLAVTILNQGGTHVVNRLKSPW